MFAASYKGSCNFGCFYLQQAFRKLSGKSHLQALLLQAIGEVQFLGVFLSSKLFRNYCGSSISRVSVLQQSIGEVPLWSVFFCIKLFGKLHSCMCSVFLRSNLLGHHWDSIFFCSNPLGNFRL